MDTIEKDIEDAITKNVVIICEEKLQIIENKFSDHMVDSYIKCDICNSVFKHKRTLKSHIASIHERRKPFQCNTCHSSFAERQTLERHIVSVNDKNKPL